MSMPQKPAPRRPLPTRSMVSCLLALSALSTPALAQNDECTGAVALAFGANGPFSSVGATTSTPAWPCVTGAGNDLWFSYVPGTSGNLVVRTCGSAFDTGLEIFDGSLGCASLTSLGCNDDFCSTQSQLTVAATAGVTYYIRVGGFNAATGSFTLTVEGLLPANPRTVSFSGSAAIPGGFQVHVNHPTAAAGNVYALLWGDPFFGQSTPVVPGLTPVGLLRLDPNNFVVGTIGVFDGTGVASSSVNVPNNLAFYGYTLHTQSVDLDVANTALHLAQNKVGVALGAQLGTIRLAQSSGTSTTVGDNVIQAVDSGLVTLPQTVGIPPFSFLPIRHRGDDGIVEGYAGTFSGTAHNSDIDSISNRRVARRTLSPSCQVVTCPNGYDIALIRDRANGRQYSVLSLERATGTARIVPGTTWLDTSTTSATPAQQRFYFGFSRDGQWAAMATQDSNTTTPFVPKVLAFRTDGQSPAIDITPAGTVATDQFFDGTICYSNDFLMVVGTQGWFWTSATAPATLQSIAVPNTTASNAAAIWVFPFSWRVSPDGSTIYFATGSNSAASRAEMDIMKVTNNGGTPLAVNHTQFALPTGIAEFGYAATSPSNVNNSSTGIKASVSPDSTKIAFLGATTTTTAFPGLYVADGTPNPTLYTVPAATFYSEVAFINNTTVMFFAGTAPAATNHLQSLYKLDVPTGIITQIGTAVDHRTRGQFFSLNRNWWYFIRSRTASDINNIVGVNCATAQVYDVTGTEFGGGGSVGTIRTGSFNTTADPWFALEMQLRRAPVGDYAYFTARKETGTAAVFEDSNVFRFDIENGGTAVQLTNNTTTGALTAIKQIESLMISRDGNHLAWGQRVNTVTTTSEDVFHMDLTTNTITQKSVSNPAGQSVSDGCLLFTGGASPTGLVWTIGTGSVGTPTANTKVEWAPLGTGAPIRISTPIGGTRVIHVIGAN